MEPVQLEILADNLANTFPAINDAPLARTLLTELAGGAPVTLAHLSSATRRPAGVVSAAAVSGTCSPSVQWPRTR